MSQSFKNFLIFCNTRNCMKNLTMALVVRDLSYRLNKSTRIDLSAHQGSFSKISQVSIIFWNPAVSIEYLQETDVFTCKTFLRPVLIEFKFCPCILGNEFYGGNWSSVPWRRRCFLVTCLHYSYRIRKVRKRNDDLRCLIVHTASGLSIRRFYLQLSCWAICSLCFLIPHVNSK